MDDRDKEDVERSRQITRHARPPTLQDVLEPNAAWRTLRRNYSVTSAIFVVRVIPDPADRAIVVVHYAHVPDATSRLAQYAKFLPHHIQAMPLRDFQGLVVSGAYISTQLDNPPSVSDDVIARIVADYLERREPHAEK